MTWGLELDPLNLLYRHHLAVGLRHLGRLEDAEVELRKVLEIDGNFPLALETLGAICAQQGRFEEALTLTERAYAFTPWASLTVGQCAALLVRSGATSRADALIETLQRGEVCGAPAGLALFYAMGGEFDRAAEYAERAIDERHPLLVRTLRPLMPSKWPALARKMNLPEICPGQRSRLSAASPISCGRQSRKLGEPVQNDAQMRDPRFTLHHQEPLAIGADVVVGQGDCAAVRSSAARRGPAASPGSRRASSRRRPPSSCSRCDRTAHCRWDSRVERFRRRLTPVHRLVGTGIATEIHLKLTGLVRHVGHPAAIR